jgi:hypothetical protein
MLLVTLHRQKHLDLAQAIYLKLHTAMTHSAQVFDVFLHNYNAHGGSLESHYHVNM